MDICSVGLFLGGFQNIDELALWKNNVELIKMYPETFVVVIYFL